MCQHSLSEPSTTRLQLHHHLPIPIFGAVRFPPFPVVLRIKLLQGTMLTSIHKNLSISLFLLSTFGPDNYFPRNRSSLISLDQARPPTTELGFDTGRTLLGTSSDPDEATRRQRQEQQAVRPGQQQLRGWAGEGAFRNKISKRAVVSAVSLRMFHAHHNVSGYVEEVPPGAAATAAFQRFCPPRTMLNSLKVKRDVWCPNCARGRTDSGQARKRGVCSLWWTFLLPSEADAADLT